MSRVFSNRLKAEREEKGWSKAYVADKIGEKYSTYTNWEYTDREPDYETLVKLAKLFDVTTDYLLGKTDVKHNIQQSIIKVVLELSDDNIHQQFLFTIDNEPLSVKQVKRLVAFIRAEREVS